MLSTVGHLISMGLSSLLMTAVIDTECAFSLRQYPFEFVKHNVSAHQRIQAFTVKFSREISPSELQQILQQEPCVLSFAKNDVLQSSADPLLSQQKHLSTLSFEPADEIFFHSSLAIQAPVLVGVVDSGIDYLHPDLQNSMWPSLGYDFVNEDNNPTDDFGHGTHVAGLIGAQHNNSIGGTGVMGAKVQLMSLKSQDNDGNGLLADVVNAIRWGADHGAEVLNLSLASKIKDDLVEEVIQYAINHGVVIVVSSGNFGEQITVNNFVSPASYGPAYNGLLSVGSFDGDNFTRSSFSNYSSTFVELAAAGEFSGEGLLSTLPNGQYSKEAGTSMSAPQVSAAVALTIGFLKTHGMSRTPAEIEAHIKSAAIRDSNLSSSFENGQRINLERLARYLLNFKLVESEGGFDEIP